MTRVKDWMAGLFEGKGIRTREAASGDRPEDGGESPSFEEGDSEFALAMYGQLRQRSRNLFFSPFSLRIALGMAAAGARGETAKEMKRVLRLPAPDEKADAAFSGILQRCRPDALGECEMAVANALWSQEGAPLRSEFLGRVAGTYGGAMNAADFIRQSGAARLAINQWVEERSKGRIREILSPGILTGLTRLVVVNAVYFRGAWAGRFQEQDTFPKLFHREGGGMQPTPLMSRCAEMRYMKGTGYQAVDLGYRGDELSMLVLLPDRKQGLWDLEGALSARMLHDCVEKLEPRKVMLLLPRFSLTWGAESLSQPLNALGMGLAFDRDRADFSGINDRKPPGENALFLSEVFHKAFLDVSEEGTEAAAASAMALRALGTHPLREEPFLVFRADHPFLFAIRDRRSGMILFLGRFADPLAVLE